MIERLPLRRIVVIGTSGSGKTTLAHRLAATLGSPLTPMDAVFHQPDWTPLPVEEFRRRMTDLVARDAWVIDGNYSVVRDVVFEAADVIVWLDLPKWLAMARITRRTVGRGLTGQEMWNGNSEDWRNAFKRGPEENMIVWTWSTHGDRHRRYAAMQAGEWSHKHWIRLRTRRDVESFARSVERSSATIEPA